MTEHGQKVYSNIQRPFCWGLEWVCKNHANAPVVSTTPTGGMATTPTMTVPSKPSHVGICTCVSRPTQLQQTPIYTNRNEIPGARQTTQTTDICTALQKGFIIGTSFQHYWCQKIWMKDTHGARISGAVWFKHKYLTNP